MYFTKYRWYLCTEKQHYWNCSNSLHWSVDVLGLFSLLSNRILGKFMPFNSMVSLIDVCSSSGLGIWKELYLSFGWL